MTRYSAIIKCKNTYSDGTESMRPPNYYYLTILSKTTVIIQEPIKSRDFARLCASIFECTYFSPSNKLSSIPF